MAYNYSVTYVKCQQCHAKIKCDQCDAECSQRILALPGVTGVQLNLMRKTLTVEGSIDEDDLLDELEEFGLFAD